ncbi:MAG: transposase [Deltaproteobacteria bacterium]|jgi:REP element-mobilizing transposase RayT|nr:transposase [Deltaproteobacteria bacterium]
MQPLEKSLRNKLEKMIKDARDIAEDAARAALEQLGVGEPSAYPHLTEADRKLRRKLRAHGRQLGNGRNAKGEQALDRLIEGVAYEHWHRMLFARFLAENNLLMYPDPDDPVAVTLEECEDLAADEGASNGWELASRYAARMLPQIFRPDSPVFQLTLPPEHQQKLERLIADLSQGVFTASDSLGWVYQFWQAKKKDEINASEVKIGARELPAVTQLFTEPYMVSFLLDNSLGAWWAVRRLSEADLKNAKTEGELRRKASLPGVALEYLRFVKVEAASSRLKEIGYFHKEDSISNLAGNLPHWRQKGVSYFVTFRTADSLPHEKLTKWKTEKEAWIADHSEPHNEKTKREFYKKFPERLQQWLDQGHGECLLKQQDLKDIVERAMLHFDDVRYDLDAFVIMPNHVHVLVTPKRGHALSAILHSWKSFTANEINKRTARTGAFWQKESFDHIVRNPAQLEKIRQYIREHSAYGYDEKRQDAASTMWQPAAGTFESWPEHLSELKTLDPCCGSGHFLVAAFLMLVPMRMEREGLSARQAVDLVLSENIHGLELDQRCVELAAFALALTGWRYPGAGGYRPLPELNVACSGLSVGGSRAEWERLANGNSKLRVALVGLYEEFKDAPVLGSLIDPTRGRVAKLIGWNDLAGTLAKALEKERTDEQHEAGIAAHGLAEAAGLLAGKYHWVITNVPYLTRGKQDERLRDFCEKNYPAAKNDLATVFLDRCLELCVEEPSRLLNQATGSRFHFGTVSVVLPQNWLFLTSYKKLREKLLKDNIWHLIARLGPGAFETISGEVVKAILISLSRGNVEEASSLFKQSGSDFQPLDKKRQVAASTFMRGLDVSEPPTAAKKAVALLNAEIKSVEQAKQLENPDARVALDEMDRDTGLLEKIAESGGGASTFDLPRFIFNYWEHPEIDLDTYFPSQSLPDGSAIFTGRSFLLKWQKGTGELYQLMQDKKDLENYSSGIWIVWSRFVGRRGVLVSMMRGLPVTPYDGFAFDNNTGVIIPTNEEHLPAIWAFCSSEDYVAEIRKIDQKLNVTSGTLVKVPFDLLHWTKIAEEQYPNGLPKPYSDDPTQWIFHGHPCGSVVWDEEKKRLEVASTLRTDSTVLQVAVARLLGYRWPAESRSGILPLESDEKRQDGASTMELADEHREWVKRCEELLPFADDDGIVCIPPVRGEMRAEDRLENLLAAAYGSEWSSNKKSELLAQAGHTCKTLDTWLRDKFFIQHCKLFHHRPFIWHIWDGLRDGFAALVNYHKLDAKLLETLIYTYLGDWISRQKQGIGNGVDGVQEKLAAAEALKKKLELILEGEVPYDIFVRWKNIEKQSIGWNPDLNDGIRLNIRPFMTVPDVGKKGAGILRDRPNIKWMKDRGKDVASAPWYHLGPIYGGNEGDRINDHHLTLEEKRKAREQIK